MKGNVRAKQTIHARLTLCIHTAGQAHPDKVPSLWKATQREREGEGEGRREEARQRRLATPEAVSFHAST